MIGGIFNFADPYAPVKCLLTIMSTIFRRSRSHIHRKIISEYHHRQLPTRHTLPCSPILSRSQVETVHLMHSSTVTRDSATVKSREARNLCRVSG